MGQEKREEDLEATAPLQEEVRGQHINVARGATVWAKTVDEAVEFPGNFATVYQRLGGLDEIFFVALLLGLALDADRPQVFDVLDESDRWAGAQPDREQNKFKT